MESLTPLAITGTKCIKKRQKFFFVFYRRLRARSYIDVPFYTPHSHPARRKDKVIVGCGFSESCRKFSNIFQQSVQIAVYHNVGEISPTHPWGGDPVLTLSWTKGYSLQNFIAFARIVSKCINNKQTNFFLYIYRLTRIIF